MEFASPEWVAAVVAALNAHPELGEALRGLGRDAAIVVEADPPAWPRTVAAWGEHDGGRIRRWRFLEDEDDILEIEPAYVVRARYGVWRSLLAGADPMQAALSGRMRVEGDLEALARRARYGHVLDEILSAVRTEFP